jgi:hypothetical protein
MVGEFALFIRDPFLCYIPHRQPAHPAETAMVERFRFGSICFFQCPAFAPPECYIDKQVLDKAYETDIDRFCCRVIAASSYGAE